MENRNRNIPDIVIFANTLYNEEFKLISRLELPNGRENNLHYDRIIENWVNIRIQGIRDGNYLGDRNQWMEDYIDGYFREFLDILLNITRHANSYHYNQDNKSKSRYTQGYLKLFKFLESDLGMTSLELNTFSNERQAVKMQDYLLARIDEIGLMLKSDFFINTNRNPIMVHIKEYKDRIQNSIDFERLKYRSEDEKRKSDNSKLEYNNSKDFIELIHSGKFSKSVAIQNIKDKFNDEDALKGFIEEFRAELKYHYWDLIMDIVDNPKDLNNLEEYYTQMRLELPKIYLTEIEIKKFNHFLFNKDGILYAFNISGFQNKKDGKECILLNDLVKTVYGDLCFGGDLMVCEKYPEMELLWEIEKSLNNESDKNEGFIFENKLDDQEPSKVYRYFHEKLCDSNMLDENALKEYLVMAFQEKKPPEIKFILNAKSKRKVIRVFYEFYKISGNKYGNKTLYSSLIGDYFQGYTTESVSNNFDK